MTDVEEIQPNRPIHEASLSSSRQLFSNPRYQKQRRISWNKHGLRVSRRLPAKSNKGSPPTVGKKAPPLQAPHALEHAYWDILPSPSSYRNSGTSRPVNSLTPDRPRNEAGGVKRSNTSKRSKDKARLPREGQSRGHEPGSHKRQGPKTSKREKRFGLADPLAWDIINRSLSQQQRLSCLLLKDELVPAPLRQTSNKAIEPDSRTSSQRKALRRFARELEKYADAAGSAGRARVVTPATSESRASFHTVGPLVPYKDEFRAAGLAVTSSDQDRNLARFARKPNVQNSTRGNASHDRSKRGLRSRQKLDGPSDNTSSGTSASPSCTSSGSYVEFTPLIGHMLHDIEPLVPRNKKGKTRSCQHARKRLLSWFLKKPSIKHGTVRGHDTPVRIQHVKGGRLKSEDVLDPALEPSLPQHRSHKPTMQSIPEIQMPPDSTLPAKYVTPKKDACVALADVHCEQSDQGRHPEQEDQGHPDAMDAKQSLGGVGLRGKKDMARGALPKLPEAIETIQEETGAGLYPRDGNEMRIDGPLPMRPKERLGVAGPSRRRPDVAASATHESSIPSLPFAARLAISTTSSIQRALDDACQKVDDENQKSSSLSEQGDMERELPPIPLRHAENRALPRMPRSTDRFIYVKRNMPPVETHQSISKPLPPEPLCTGKIAPEKSPPHPSHPSHAPHAPHPPHSPHPPHPPHPPHKPPRALAGHRANAVAELSKAEDMLKDLDVFLNDKDDASIEDRDVIRGLQVAIHAAADDLYDGYIRHRTGLRIRRFLADLRSFEDIHEMGEPTDPGPERKGGKSKRDENTRNQKEGGGVV